MKNSAVLELRKENTFPIIEYRGNEDVVKNLKEEFNDKIFINGCDLYPCDKDYYEEAYLVGIENEKIMFRIGNGIIIIKVENPKKREKLIKTFLETLYIYNGGVLI